MAKVAKDYIKRLVMDDTTTHEAYTALKKKSVFKARQCFTKLDKDWNKSKATDASAGPDKVIVALDEDSKNLKKFKDMHKKYTLNILSNIEVSILDRYQHTFTLFNTDSEHNKTAHVQLEIAKRMIRSHFEKYVAKEVIKEEGFIMCINVSNGSSQDYKNKSGLRSEHFIKPMHIAYTDRKSFCHALIAALKDKRSKAMRLISLRGSITTMERQDARF